MATMQRTYQTKTPKRISNLQTTTIVADPPPNAQIEDMKTTVTIANHPVTVAAELLKSQKVKERLSMSPASPAK